MLRLLAILCGVVLILLDIVARVSLPPSYQLPHAGALLGSLVTLAASLWQSSRQGETLGILALIFRGWVGALIASAIAGVIASPDATGIGTGLGVGLVIGLLASAALTVIAFGLQPAWFRRARKGEGVTNTDATR